MPPDLKPGSEGGTATVTSPDAPDTSSQDSGGESDGGESTGEQTSTPKTGSQQVAKKGGLTVPIAKPRSRFGERISELTQRRKVAEEEARSFRERLAKYEGTDGQPITRGQGDKLPGQRGDGLGDPNGELKPEEFETYGQYVEALVSRTIENAAKRQQGERGEQAMERHRTERRESFEAAAAPLIEAHGDAFMEAITDDNLPVSDAMADAVLELDEIAPYVMLWLANNPKESLKMSKMNPRAATVSIGRLASKLDYEIQQGNTGTPGADTATGGGDEVAAAPPAIPQRPAPSVVPAPRGGSPTNLDNTPSDKMDTKSWMIAEANRLRSKYGPHVKTWVPK